MKYSLIHPETEKVWATFDDTKPSAELSVRVRDLVLEISQGGHRKIVHVSPLLPDGSVHVATEFGSFRLLLQRGEAVDAAGGAGAGKKTLKSSMPGKVVRILCKAGDSVERNQPVLILEAMKMENEIRAPIAGTIEEVSVTVGATVETGAILLKISAL